MQSAVAQKPVNEKSSHTEAPHVNDVKHKPSHELGAEAGMPLFLQRASSSIASSLADVQRLCDECEQERVEDSPQVQPKFSVGPADDEYEREADRVADTVMRMPEPNTSGNEQTTVHSEPLANQITSLVRRMPEAATDQDAVLQPLSDQEPEQEEAVQANPRIQRQEEEQEQEKEQEQEESIQAKLVEPAALKAEAVEAPLQREVEQGDNKIQRKLEPLTTNAQRSEKSSFVTESNIHRKKDKPIEAKPLGIQRQAEEQVQPEVELIQPQFDEQSKLSAGAADDPLQRKSNQVGKIIRRMPGSSAINRMTANKVGWQYTTAKKQIRRV